MRSSHPAFVFLERVMLRPIRVIASAAKQSIAPQVEMWIVSLRSQ